MKRREFLKRSAVGVGGLLAGAHLDYAEQTKPAYFDPYETFPWGKPA